MKNKITWKWILENIGKEILDHKIVWFRKMVKGKDVLTCNFITDEEFKKICCKEEETDMWKDLEDYFKAMEVFMIHFGLLKEDIKQAFTIMNIGGVPIENLYKVI